MTAQPIDVDAAQRLISDGALLVDVREPDEHARERIPNARLVPLSRLPTRLNLHGAPTVIFYCRSGSRTAAAADKLAALAGGDAYILTLQLPFCFEVGALSGGLVSPAPE